MKKPFLQFSILLVIVMMIASVIANTVNAAPMGAGVTIDSGKTSKTGQPGSTVKYKLTITNTDAAAIDVKLSAVSAGVGEYRSHQGGSQLHGCSRQRLHRELHHFDRDRRAIRQRYFRDSHSLDSTTAAAGGHRLLHGY